MSATLTPLKACRSSRKWPSPFNRSPSSKISTYRYPSLNGQWVQFRQWAIYYAQGLGGLPNFVFNLRHIEVTRKFNCVAGRILGPFEGKKNMSQLESQWKKQLSRADLKTPSDLSYCFMSSPLKNRWNLQVRKTPNRRLLTNRFQQTCSCWRLRRWMCGRSLGKLTHCSYSDFLLSSCH